MHENVRLVGLSGTVHTRRAPLPDLSIDDSRKIVFGLIGGAETMAIFTRGGRNSIAGRLHARGHHVELLEIPEFQSNPTALYRFRWPTTIERFKDKLNPIVRHRRVRLVGHSLGALAAIALAAEPQPHPSGFPYHCPTENLVLLCPGFCLDRPLAKMLDGARSRLGRYEAKLIGRTDKPFWFQAPLYFRHPSGKLTNGYEKLAAKIPELREELKVSDPVWYEYWPLCAVGEYLWAIPEVRRELYRLSCPVKILYGALDPLISAELRVNALFRPEHRDQVTIEQVPLWGHFGPMIYPGDAVELITAA